MTSEILYKQLTAFIFLAAFLTQTFSRPFIVVDYYTNTKAYAKNCENRANLKMHCNGKCQMMKKLKQEENKDKQNPNRKGDNKDEVLSFKSFFPSIQIIVTTFKKKFPAIKASFAINRNSDIFHPPQASYSRNSDI